MDEQQWQMVHHSSNFQIKVILANHLSVAEGPPNGSVLARVYNPPEILAMTIGNLPIQEALGTAGVCRHWRTVGQLAQIQQGCFLREIPNTPIQSTGIWIVDWDIEMSQSLADVSKRHVTQPITITDDQKTKVRPNMVYGLSTSGVQILNPLIPHLLHCARENYHKYGHPVLANFGMSAVNPKWTEMFLTQPPTISIILQQHSDQIGLLNAPGSIPRGFQIFNPTGVTIGDLAAWIEQHRNTEPDFEWDEEWFPVYSGVLAS